MGYAAGALFVVGGLLVTVSTLLPSVGEGMAPGPLYAISAVAAVTGVLFIAYPVRIPDLLYYGANTAGSLLIAGVIYFSDATMAASYGVLYVFVAAYAFLFFRRDIAVIETLIAGVAFAVSLSIHPGDPSMAPVVVVFGGCVMAGGLIGTLGQQARQLAEREAEAAERLRQLDSMKSIFLQALSHELRTPLAVLLGAAETLETHHDTLDPEQVRQLAQRQVDHGQRLLRMVTDLLDVDRLAAGRLTPRPQRVRIDELAERCLDRFDLPDRDVALVRADPIEAEVDPAYVERVLEQLVLNVATHTPSGSAASVYVAAVGLEAVRISVMDAGPGIPQGEREAVFEPFHRSDDYRPGVGVGLALVRHLVESHSGRVWISDHEGGGAAVHVELPVRFAPGRPGDEA